MNLSTHRKPVMAAVLLLALAIHANAQEPTGIPENPARPVLKAESIPPAPATTILDEGRIFDERQLNELSTQLVKLKTDYQIDLYVAGYAFILGETIDDRAARLKKAWGSDNYGIIIVYERGTSKITFSGTDSMPGAMSRIEMVQLFRDAADAAKVHTKASDRITAAAQSLANALTTTQKVAIKQKGVLTKYHWLAFGLSCIGILLAGAAFLIMSRMQRKEKVKSSEIYYFPHIRVDPRFGAKFGGGVLGEGQYPGHSQ